MARSDKQEREPPRAGPGPKRKASARDPIGPFYSIYLYRVRIVDGNLVAKEMYQRFKKAEGLNLGDQLLGQRVGEMIDHIRADDGDYADMGDDFAEMVRRRKGFCILVVEGNGVLESIEIRKKNGDTYTDNFKSGGLLVVPVKDGGTMTVGYWVDIMKDGIGDLRQGNRQKPKIKYWVRTPGIRDLDEFVDSGGTNMGPPLKPPGRKFSLKAARAIAESA